MIDRAMKWMAALLCAVVLGACGGGGSSPVGSSSSTSGGTTGGSTSGTTSGTLAVSLSTTTVTASNPATVKATLVDTSGTAIGGAVVTFTTTLGLGTFNVGTALTDGTGTATVVLSPAASTTAGADTVVATASVAGTAITGSAGFQLTATNVTISSFTSAIGSAALSAYGQTALTLTLGNEAKGVPVSVSVSSDCVTKSKATLTPATITTTSGVANFTFNDQGCGATTTADSVQAQIGASAATGSVAINLTPPSVSAISFQSATPSTIYLKGSGLTETSTVVFKVVDLAGAALPNQIVTLDATTLAGGLTLDGVQTSVTKTSDANGLVSVLVNSGTVPTPVRIKASLSLPSSGTITTVSSALAIGVGLPSELNFSLSQGTFNIEGFDIDGTPNTYNIIASDRMGNPVPAGTAVSFVTEGGQIESSKQIALTANGLARTTANFVSSAPRPSDGRITIVSYALGEESFLDLNGNNVYDSGEDFQDLGDIYLDRAYNGAYDASLDQLISLTLPGGNSTACVAPTSPLLAFGPSIPSRSASCDGVWGKAYVRRAVETVLSTSAGRPLWGEVRPSAPISAAGCSTIQLTGNDLLAHNYYPVGPGGIAGLSATGAFGFLVSDANSVRLNPMAAGTTVTATATTGVTVTVDGQSTSTVPSSLTATAVGIGYTFATTATPPVTSGIITLTFTAPSNLKTIVSLPVQMAAGVACP